MNSAENPDMAYEADLSRAVAEQKETILRARMVIKALLAHLPELWGDLVTDGQIKIRVDEDAIDAANVWLAARELKL